MTKRRAARANGKRPKHAKNTLPGVSPISGTPPPESTKWKAGGPSPNPHGRPKTLKELRKLIQSVGEENLSEAQYTRIELKVRQLFASKNSKDTEHLLSYGWGKVPQAIVGVSAVELERRMEELGLTDDDIRNDPLLSGLFALTGRGVSIGAPADGADRRAEEAPAGGGAVDKPGP